MSGVSHQTLEIFKMSLHKYKSSYQNIISMANLKKGLVQTKCKMSLNFYKNVKANFTDKKLESLARDLKSQRFKPSPVKSINILKSSGNGTRHLRLASQRDKIVQAAILNILEPIFESVFLDCSYGGRRNKNGHHVLKHIKTKWRNVTWFINIDFSKYFDFINYSILLSMLEKYCDQATIELIQKFIECGYIDFYKHPNIFEKSKTNYQSYIISATLFNLFFHPLDCFVRDSLFFKWKRREEQTPVLGYQTFTLLIAGNVKLLENLYLKGTKKKLEKLMRYRWIKQRCLCENLNNINLKKMSYVRYFDDFLIGFAGTRIEANEIQNCILIFCIETLKLKINAANSYICHFSESNIEYLGYYLCYFTLSKVKKSPNAFYKYGLEIRQQPKTTAVIQVQLRIPIELLLQLMVDRGYAKKRKNSKFIRATSCRKFIFLADKFIVQRFSMIIEALMEYYSPANYRSDLWQVIALCGKSCALTLADKHKFKTVAKVYKKYGPDLKVLDLGDKTETVLFYPTTLKTTVNFKLRKNNFSFTPIF
jgi:RNA-directed DNA polymerase